MRRSDSSLKGHLPSKACSTIPSSKSPSVRSWYSAKPFSTLSRRFSMRTPVCTRSTTRRSSICVFMVPMYQGTNRTQAHFATGAQNSPAGVSIGERTQKGRADGRERPAIGHQRLAALQKISHQSLPLIREHALGMKLHPFHGVLAVPQSHDDAVAVAFHRVGADFEFGGQAVFGDDERVVAGGCHGRFQALEDGLPIMLHPARLAVHDVFRPNDLSSKS